MEWVDKFYKWLEGFLGANAVIKLFFIFADILILVFFFAIIIYFASNNAVAYRIAAKEVLRAIKKGANEATINEKMKNMPYVARSLWHRFRKERKGKPSDYLTITQCLTIPNKSSWNNRLAVILIITSLIFGGMMYAFVQNASSIRHAVTLLFIGGFLAIILLIVEKYSYNSTLYIHEKLVWALNKKSKEFAVPAGVTVPDDKRIIEEPSYITQADYTTTPIIAEGPKITKPLLNAPKVMDAETQNLLLKIDSAIKAKAPVVTLRQLASALQRLKNRPENLFPEHQQRINKAMALLLKAISESYK
jgi:hypothetical protein